MVMRAFIIGILFGTLCFIWFAQELDWSALWLQLQGLQIAWVVLAVLALLLEFVCRAIRWKIILRPMSPTIRVRDLFIAQIIGATTNTLLPLRLGEVAKPLVASNRSKLPFLSVTATSVMERVYDLFGMVTVLVFMVLFLQPSITPAPEQANLVHNLQLYGGIFGLIAIVAMGIFFYLASQRQQARNIFVSITSIAPQPIQRFFLRLFDGFVEGLGNSTDTKGMWQAGLWSVILWLNGAGAIYFLFQAFSLDLPFGAACFIGVAIALTVALPQAPGFIGVFHVAIENTIILWGQDALLSKSFALVFWAVSFLPVTIIGIVFIAREKLSWKDIKNIKNVHSDGEPKPHQ